MVLTQVSESDEEEYHSPLHDGPGDVEDGEANSVMDPPVHPVPLMQGAFEESILESMEDDDTIKASTDLNAEARRKQLLGQSHYDDSWTTRWKQRPNARHHPLLKLMAQIVFGMHLLQQGQAKSNEEVVKILQTHVNEVDSFLERTAEDFNLAIADIDERIKHLKLPMEHIDVFNTMLDNKKFRTQLLDGNDKVEKIIDRTAKAMNAALMDIAKGIQATHELGKHLDSIRSKWPKENIGIADVFGAMRGNEQGWLEYLKYLQAKGTNLGNKLVQLGTVIGEMSKLAAAASRRDRPTSRHISPSRSVSKSTSGSPGPRSKFARSGNHVPPMPDIQRERSVSLNKPLPREPGAASGTQRLAVSKAHPVPFAQRYEQPRQSPHSPPTSVRRASTMPSGSSDPPPAKSSGAPGDVKVSDNHTSKLAEFLRDSGPLRSNPPEPIEPNHAFGSVSRRATSSETKMARAQIEGANDSLNAVAGAGQPVGQLKSQGAAMIVSGRGSIRDITKTRWSNRVGEKALSTVPEKVSRKDSVTSVPSGLARRISKRMKHIPQPAVIKTEKPPAYYADAEEKSAVTAKPPGGRAGTINADSKRPPSPLASVPRATKSNAPSTPSNMSYGERQKYENYGILPNSASVASPAFDPTKGGPRRRLSSLRSIIHRRGKSQLMT